MVSVMLADDLCDDVQHAAQRAPANLQGAALQVLGEQRVAREAGLDQGLEVLETIGDETAVVAAEAEGPGDVGREPGVGRGLVVGEGRRSGEEGGERNGRVDGESSPRDHVRAAVHVRAQYGQDVA